MIFILSLQYFPLKFLPNICFTSPSNNFLCISICFLWDRWFSPLQLLCLSCKKSLYSPQIYFIYLWIFFFPCWITFPSKYFLFPYRFVWFAFNYFSSPSNISVSVGHFLICVLIVSCSASTMREDWCLNAQIGNETLFKVPVRHTSSSPKESFSPESGGRVNPSTAIEAMSTQGTIRLKK